MKPHIFKAEEKLCILFARTKLNSRILREITALLKSVTDWDYFFKLTNHHRITALVYSNIIKFGLKHSVHTGFLSLARKTYLNHKKRNKSLFKDVKTLFRNFNKSGIRFILIKGSSLIPKLYKDAALRPMSDCDILVSRKDLKNVEIILNKNGYSRESALAEISGASVPRWLRYAELMETGTISFYKKTNLPYKNYHCIEVHISLFRKSNLTFRDLTDSFYNNAIKSKFYSVPVMKLCRYDEFVYLCSHLYYNFVDLRSVCDNSALRLIRFCDIMEFLNKYRIAGSKFQKLHLSFRKSVIFCLKALYMIYDKKYFPELTDCTVYSDKHFKRVYWKINNSEHFKTISENFLDRMFILSAPEDIKILYSKVKNQQFSFHYKTFKNIQNLVSGIPLRSCRQS